METTPVARFFCSYSRDDSPFALKLARELRAVGIPVWIDQLDILGGERWDNAIQAALAASSGIIAVISPSALKSQNVMDEVSYALDEGKKMIPVLHRECVVPFRLRRMQRVDFTGDFDDAFKDLLRALRPDATVAAPGIEVPSQPAAEETASREVAAQNRPQPDPSPTSTPLASRRPRTTAAVVAGSIGGVSGVATLLAFATSSQDREATSMLLSALLCGGSAAIAGALCVMNRRRTILVLALAGIGAALGCALFADALRDVWPMSLFLGLPSAALAALIGASLRTLYGWNV